MLQPGLILGTYELLNQLSELQYIQTWRSRGADGQDYILRIFPCPYKLNRDGDEWAVGFDGAYHRYKTKEGVYGHLARTPGEHVTTLLALPLIPHVAPIFSHEIIEWENNVAFVIKRHFYSARLTDRFPANAAQPPSKVLLEAFASLALAMDTLQKHLPDLDFDLAPGDLLLDGDSPVVADYGFSQYSHHMDFNNRMWSSRVEHEGKRSLVGLYPGKDRFQRTDAQFGLAALYIYLRSRFMIFEDATTVYSQEKNVQERMKWVGAIFQATKLYQDTGVLPLMMLPDTRERAVVAKALSREPATRYETCFVFMQALSELFGAV